MDNKPDETIFKPYLAEGEKVELTRKPERRARIIRYATAAAAIAAGIIAEQHLPESKEILKSLRHMINHDGMPNHKEWLLLIKCGGIGAAIIGGLYALSSELELATTRYALTANRILKKTGLLGRNVESIAYDKMTETEVDQGLTGRLTNTGTIYFNIGTVRSTENGGTQSVYKSLKDISEPLEVSRHIASRTKRV